ncbi:hypothetical protein [Microbacterium sp. E-13]|uniref:hypothetical protein n=1 Tax=Microbacterium sp. E-13 TaxID=3404048 RepID=UPI003CF117C5
MPKQLVTALGLVVALGVIALGIFLVALPLYFQAIGVDAQTATVSTTNDLYQAQADSLRAEEENLDAINANVADLRSQIPAAGELDDVFEVVARASVAAGLPLTSVTAGEQVAFFVRTEPTDDEQAAAAPAPTATPAPTPTEGADAAGAGTPVVPDASTVPDGAQATGRQQVDFVIAATASDMAQVTAFLDALRAGPRLLHGITATSAQTGEGTIDLQVKALTFIDVEG